MYGYGQVERVQFERAQAELDRIEAATALPGDSSNGVRSGHVQSISSGNVFANIDQLGLGDEVTLRTNTGDVVYRVAGKNLVKPDDLSVVQPTGRDELTLITCAGTF